VQKLNVHKFFIIEYANNLVSMKEIDMLFYFANVYTMFVVLKNVPKVLKEIMKTEIPFSSF
jgi:hypothetical protein